MSFFFKDFLNKSNPSLFPSSNGIWTRDVCKDMAEESKDITEKPSDIL